MRRLTAINFLNQFFWAVIAITLPLYLIEKGINVEEIGLVLSLIPFTMVVFRTFLAMVSDVLGTRVFFMLQGVSQALGAAVYAVASLPIHFGIGKIFEGTSYSLFWAVDRTAIFRTAQKRGVEAAKMTSVRMVAGTLGLLLGGYVAYVFSFEVIYVSLVAVGLLTFLLASKRHDTEANHDGKLVQTLDLDKKHLLFWEAALVLGFAITADSLFLTFLLPVFMDVSLGFDYAVIGFAMAVYLAGLGIGSYLAAREELDERKLFPLQLLAVPLLALLPYSGQYFIPVIFLVGIGSGIAFGIYEDVIAKMTRKDRNLSTSIALLHLPGKILEFAMLALSGFIFVFLGGPALFVVCAFLLLLYVISANSVLKKIPAS